MDAASSAITYAFLVIPAFFALTVLSQGIVKIRKAEKDGTIVLGMGIVLCLLVVSAYWWFIR